MNTHRHRTPRILSFFSHFLFWGLNVPLTFVILYGGLGFYLPILFKEASFRQVTDTFPIDVLFTLTIFFIMPIASIVGAIVTKIFRSPIKQLQILFGVELPIMAFTLGRLIFLKTLTPVNILFLSTAAISIFAYIIYIVRKPFQNKLLLTLHLLAHQAAVVVGLYASLLMFFFLPIVMAMIVQVIQSFMKWGLPDFRYYEHFGQIILMLTGMLAFSSLFISLISSPFIGLFMYWRATNRLSKVLKAKTSTQYPRMTKWAFSLGYSFIVIYFAYQGSLLNFYGQMSSYRMMTSFEDRSQIATKILKRKSFIENRLVDTYLANYKYLTDSEMTLLKQAYEDQVKVQQPVAQRIQNWFTLVAFPFVYNGKFDDDVKKAGEYYEDIFDEPIQLAESRKVSRTLATSFNFSSDALKSNILDREDKDVRLVQKTISAQPDPTNQFATVTIEEEYENLSSLEQEVFYIFSLPQDSVMTNLQLGPDLELAKDQLENTITFTTPTPTITSTTTPSDTQVIIPTPIIQKDNGEIAAKGAANQTFENQYQRRIDPAILEQVGPVQYKLRVYPIPVKEENLSEWQRERLTAPVRNQKVRYSYVTAIDASGQAALPQITEQRNVFSNADTFTYNKGDRTVKLTNDIYLPVIDRTQPGCEDKTVQFTHDGQLTLFVPHLANHWLFNENIQFNCNDQFKNAEQQLRSKRIAILADSSHSMGIENWKSYLDTQLPMDALLGTNVVDLYFFNDYVSKPINLNQQQNNPKVWDQVAFGKTDRLRALKEVEGKYDVVLMFTDGSEADTPGGDAITPRIAQPIYLIHKDGRIPKLPDNLTYYLIANEARVVSSGREALQNFMVYQAVKKSFPSAFILVGEAGTWISQPVVNSQVISGVPPLTANPTDPIAKIAIHRHIESEMRKASSNLNQLNVLDQMNQLAQQSGIVTPFSSFIVLTTPEQREQLRQASLQEGRFVVDYDLGEAPLVQPSSGGMLGTSAVPEPHEWILMISGVGLILFLGRQKVYALLHSYHA